MPAYRIVYASGDGRSPESITASFNDLDQALSVFAARGLRILYIAENSGDRRSLETLVKDARRADAPKPAGSSSFPLRRFSGRIMA